MRRECCSKARALERLRKHCGGSRPHRLRYWTSTVLGAPPPSHTPCDGANSSNANAIGLGCPGETQVNVTTSGAAGAFGTRTSFGNTGAFPPREGARYLVIGSGLFSQLSMINACSADLGAFDPNALPAPMESQGVGAQDCAQNPNLVGTGDCSNSIQGALTSTVKDYTELRFTATVPANVTSFSYELAFLSTEYPDYYLSQYNDMYIGWLESEEWTGNVSFDSQDRPVALDSDFLEYRDANAANDPVCVNNNCSAPQLHGTCMQGHAGTRWLRTTASVAPGETITMIFAVFDVGDSVLDSYAFLDNFRWGCDGGGAPSTVEVQ